MSVYTYAEGGILVTRSACKLLSIIIVTDGGGPGKVDVYDSRGPVVTDKVATLRCPQNSNVQYHWKGLELRKGLYVDIVEKADYITVEWEPIECCVGQSPSRDG